MASPAAGLREPVQRRDRYIALASLLGIALLAWAYLWLEARSVAEMPSGMAGMDMTPGMDGMAGLEQPTASAAWRPDVLLLTALMWVIMMAGMMLPSAAPAILLYGAMVRKHRERGSHLQSIWIFALGYLAVWAGFGVAAAVLQAILQAAGLLTAMMESNSSTLSGVLLIAAGVYQWLPVKHACLEKCRAPLQFFMMHWKPGAAGAFRMGARHGATCVGCCWTLMLLLFAAGVMNLVWVALLAAIVLVEKLLPGGRIAGLALGGAMIAAGAAVLADPSLLPMLRF